MFKKTAPFIVMLCLILLTSGCGDNNNQSPDLNKTILDPNSPKVKCPLIDKITNDNGSFWGCELKENGDSDYITLRILSDGTLKIKSGPTSDPQFEESLTWEQIDCDVIEYKKDGRTGVFTQIEGSLKRGTLHFYDPSDPASEVFCVLE
jgi:hypothetical protein